MVQLQGKKILLLAPRFYGYEDEIITKLKKFGADVTYLNDDPSELFTMLFGAYKKLGGSQDKMINHFEIKCFTQIPRQYYDYVLVICGWAITSRIIDRIKRERLKPEGRMVLYYWDSLARLQDDITRWDYFDDVFTFDLEDYKKNRDRVKFLPLFYCDKYWFNSQQKEKYDVMSIGSFRLNRLDFLKKLIQANPSLNIFHYLYSTKWLIRFHKTLRKKYRNVSYDELKYKKLSFHEVVALYSQCKAVLDVPAIGQTGLTIRTFETLAMHKKLITTNETVRQYDFYNPDIIFVLHPGEYSLPTSEWFEKPFNISDDVIRQYSISSWLKKLLGYE